MKKRKSSKVKKRLKVKKSEIKKENESVSKSIRNVKVVEDECSA